MGADKWGRERKGPGGRRGEVVRRGRGESIVGGGKVRGEVVSWGAAVARIVVGLPVHLAIWYLTVFTLCPNVHGTIVTAAQDSARCRGHLVSGEIGPIPGGGAVKERSRGKRVGGRGTLTYGRKVNDLCGVTQIRVHVYVTVCLVVSGVATAALITVGSPMISAIW